MLISVIIPAYNSASRIKFSLESVIVQNFSQLEIILVDDASQDNTPVIAREILKSSQRNFKIITHAKNFGVSAARNTGLENSNGEYVCFLDADDLLHKNFLSRLHELITKYSADFSFCELDRIFLDGNHAQNNSSHKNFLDCFMKKNGTVKNSIHQQNLLGVLDGENNLPHKNFLFRLGEFMKKHSGTSENFSDTTRLQNFSGFPSGENNSLCKNFLFRICEFMKKYSGTYKNFSAFTSGENNLPHKNFLIRLGEFLKKYTGTGKNFFDATHMQNFFSFPDGENNLLRKKFLSQKIISQNLSGVANGEDFIFKKTISPVCCLYDKKFLNDNDLRFFAGCSSGEDVEFQIKALCSTEKVAFTSERLYFYVQHDNMGSVRDNNTREKKIIRYEHNTSAQIRTALFLAEHTQSERVKNFNERILQPQNIIRKCNLYAIKKDREGYNSLVNDESARKILKRCAFGKKPEIFFKAFMILHFPNIYYRLREK